MGSCWGGVPNPVTDTGRRQRPKGAARGQGLGEAGRTLLAASGRPALPTPGLEPPEPGGQVTARGTRRGLCEEVAALCHEDAGSRLGQLSVA